MPSIDELFGGPAPEAPATGHELPPGAEMIVPLPLNDLYMFKDHPFSVVDDKEMFDLSDTIKANGVLMPAIVRPHPTRGSGYEIVAGHRRKRGSELAGLDTMPCIIREMDDDTATIYMVDSNNQRENVKPSEKAKALKMKLEAMKRQGARTDLTSTQREQKFENNKTSVEIVAEQAGESRASVQRLIRLNELAPELLEKVDKSELALTPAVELSYLPQEEQKQVAELIEVEGRTPSLSQAQQIKRLSQEKKLDDDTLGEIFIKPKPQEQRSITLKGERLEKFFAAKFTPSQFEDIVYRALDEYFQRQQKKERKFEEVAR